MKKSPVHLNALRAFEASARHRSFAAAANELNVTPAAVGQLVRTLEEWLGTALFNRSSAGRSRLMLTPAAERALPDIRAGFDRLTLGLERLKEETSSNVLTVTVSPAFAVKWLLPRIDRFHSAHPDTDVRLETSLGPIDFVAQRVDVGVRYGLGHWPGLIATKLMEEEVYPVCSPAIRERIASPADLANETLIHDLSMEGHDDFPSWRKWFERAGVAHVDATRGLRINNSAAVLQAAAEGQGVGLARSVMAREDLASGRLVRIFPTIEYRSPLAYYVVHREECSALPRLVAFRAWLQEESQSLRRRDGFALVFHPPA